MADSPPLTKRSILKTALDRFKAAAEAEEDQRRAERDDLAFVETDRGQWPEAIWKERQGSTSGPVVKPARPCLTIDKLDAPINQILNSERNAKLAIQIKPKSGGAKKETAEILQGLIRHIEVESRAHVARGWAFERATKCGRGVYRILKTYANDGDFDVDLVIARVLDQAKVYFDPFAQEPDWSDGEWCFICEDMPWRKFKREFKDSHAAKSSSIDEEFQGLGDEAQGWMRGDGEQRTIRVAEYFYVETTRRTLILTEAGYQGFEDDRPPNDTSAIVNTRTIDTRHVKWCKLTAIEVLEEAEWDGRYIPVIPVIGREAFLEGKRLFRGIVRKAKDAQRSYNYMRSKQVEAVGLAPLAPYVMAEGQNEGREDMWANANTVAYSALVYKPTTVGGTLAPPPARNVVEPAIQAITLAAHEADNDIKATTGYSDPSLGKSNPADRSGRAIQALQRQSETGSSHFLDNLASISMTYEGKVLLDLIPKVYDRPGRIAQILGDDDTQRTVMLNHPFVPGPNGEPQPLPPGQTPPPDQTAQHYDLSKGQYSVVVAVGKSYSTRREEGVAMMGELVSAAPQLAPVVSDLWVAEMDFPGATAIAERLKKTLPPGLQDDPQGGIPPAAQAQIQQAQQTIAMLQQQMQQMAQVLQTKQLEADAKKAIAEAELNAKVQMQQLELASKERLEQLKLQLEAMKANAQIDMTQRKAAVELAVDTQRHEAELQHDAVQREHQRQHEAAVAVTTQAARPSGNGQG